MDYVHVNRLCLCLLVFLALSASGAENGLEAEVSASIQATATVISPVGLSESRSMADGGWLLYAPDPEGILIQVSRGGQMIDEFGPTEAPDECGGLALPRDSHISFVSCKRLVEAMQIDTLVTVVTVIYSDN